MFLYRPALALTLSYLSFGCESVVVLNADAETPTSRLSAISKSFDLPGDPLGDRLLQARTSETNSLLKTGPGRVPSPEVYAITDSDEAINGRASFGTRFLLSDGLARRYFPERVSLQSVPFEVYNRVIEVSWQGIVPELESNLGRTSPGAVRISATTAGESTIPVAKLLFLNYRRAPGDDERDPRSGERDNSSCYSIIVSVPRNSTEDNPDTEDQVGRFMSRFDLAHEMKMTLVSGTGRFTLEADGILVRPDNYSETGDPGWCTDGTIGVAKIRASFPRNSLEGAAGLEYSVQAGYIDEFWPPNRYDYVFDDIKILYYR